MKKRLVALTLALAVLCHAAISFALGPAFGPFDSINTTGTTLKGLGTNRDPTVPNQKTPGGVTPIANLAANTEACVKTVRDCFRWEPTSLLTADDITVVNPTANGSNQGRFIRLLRPSPSWRDQSAWFVSTAGNDENDGSTSLTPVKTDAEIKRRWGNGPVAISGTVTITYAQSASATTNFDIDLVGDGLVKFVGGFTVAQSNISLSAVQAQVRTGGAEAGLAITGTGLGASDVGKLVEITSGTAGNIGAYARVLKNETGGKVRISPMGKFNPTNFAAQFATVTPQIGDVVRVITPFTMPLGLVTVRSHSLGAGGTTPAVVFDSLLLDGSGGGNFSDQGAIEANGASVYIGRSIVLGATMRSRGNDSNFIRLCGGGADSVYVRDGQVEFNKCGVTDAFFNIGITVKAGGVATITSDTYIQNAKLLVDPGGIVLSSGAAVFDRSTSNAGIVVAPGGRYQQTGVVPDWGTGNTGHGVVVQSGGLYTYATKPTVNSGLGAGREAQVGGTDKLWSAIPFIETANNAAFVLTQ